MPHHTKGDAQRKAAQDAAENSQSTHGSAAQASAARLIRALRKAYPHVIITAGSHATTGSSAATAETGAAQNYLCAYLAHLVNPTNPFTPNADLHRDRSIASTIRVINFIKNKQAANGVLEILLSIAKTYPGGEKWTDADAHWSKNKIYNSQSQQMEEIAVYPAEVLNLYCAAICDANHMPAPSGSSIDRDREDRMDSLFNYLRELKHEETKGNYETCAAGRQHGLLFLLNGVFCEAVHGSPIELITDQDSFILKAVSEFITEQLDKTTPSKAQEAVSNWVLYQANQIPCDIAPVITFLRNQFPSDDQNDPDNLWKATLKQYVQRKFEEIGLNPAIITPKKVDEFAGNLEYLQPPTVSPLISEVIASQSIVAAGQFRDLIEKRNRALAIFKDHYRSNPQSLSQQQIESSFFAETLFQTLYKNRHDTLLTGANATEYQRALEAVKTMLISCYNNEPLPQNFNQIKNEYISAQRELHQHTQHERVENFFARNNTSKLMANALRELSLEPLTDNALAQWRAESAEGVLDITPYEVNRILLHALLTLDQARQWSNAFKSALNDVISWLLTNPAESDASNTAFRRVYDSHILHNLLYLSLAGNIDSNLNQYFKNSENALQRLQSTILKRAEIFFRRPFNDYSISNLSDAQFDQLFDAVKSHFNIFIGDIDIYSYSWFLELVKTAEQRTDIIRVTDWTRLVNSTSNLCDILKIAVLDENHHRQIWDKVKEKLGSLITNLSCLLDLLNTTAVKNNNDMKQDIWRMVESRLDDLLTPPRHEPEFFFRMLCSDMPTLTTDQCTKIFCANVEKNSNILIIYTPMLQWTSWTNTNYLKNLNNSSDCLRSLFKLYQNDNLHGHREPLCIIRRKMLHCFKAHPANSNDPLPDDIAQNVIQFFQEQGTQSTGARAQPTGAALHANTNTDTPFLQDPYIQAYRNKFQQSDLSAKGP